MIEKKIDKQKLKNFDKICQEISNGKRLFVALKDNKLGNRFFYGMVDKYEVCREMYARAKDLQIEAKFQSIEEDYMAEPQRDPETGRIDPAWVQLQRLKIDAKKWELAKLKPRVFGDKVDITSNGEQVTTTVINLGTGIAPQQIEQPNTIDIDHIEEVKEQELKILNK